MTLFSTKNGKLLVHFSCSFTQKLGFVGLKMQTFKNGFQRANLTKKHEFVRHSASLQSNIANYCLTCIIHVL